MYQPWADYFIVLTIIISYIPNSKFDHPYLNSLQFSPTYKCLHMIKNMLLSSLLYLVPFIVRKPSLWPTQMSSCSFSSSVVVATSHGRWQVQSRSLMWVISITIQHTQDDKECRTLSALPIQEVLANTLTTTLLERPHGPASYRDVIPTPLIVPSRLFT